MNGRTKKKKYKMTQNYAHYHHSTSSPAIPSSAEGFFPNNASLSYAAANKEAPVMTEGQSWSKMRILMISNVIMFLFSFGVIISLLLKFYGQETNTHFYSGSLLSSGRVDTQNSAQPQEGDHMQDQSVTTESTHVITTGKKRVHGDIAQEA